MEIEHGSGWVRLGLSGDIDARWSDEYGPEIRSVFEGRPREIVVEVDSVTFMDSTGLGFIARCVKECQSQEGTVYLVGSNSIIRSLVDMVGLSQLLTIVDTPSEKRDLYQRLGQVSTDRSRL